MISKNRSFVIILLLFTQAITSQGQVNLEKFREFQDISSRHSKGKTNAEGTPYIQKDFMSVKLDKFPNKIFTGKYNAHKGEMHIDIGDKVIILNSSEDYKITFTNTKKIYQTQNYNSKQGNKKRGFLVLINESKKHSLFKEEIIRLQDEIPATSSYDTAKPARFKRENDIYYIKKDDIVTHLPTKKKSLLKRFPKHAKAIKGYLKDNKLSTSKEADLIKIAQYISTL